MEILWDPGEREAGRKREKGNEKKRLSGAQSRNPEIYRYRLARSQDQLLHGSNSYSTAWLGPSGQSLSPHFQHFILQRRGTNSLVRGNVCLLWGLNSNVYCMLFTVANKVHIQFRKCGKSIVKGKEGLPPTHTSAGDWTQGLELSLSTTWTTPLVSQFFR
jgi:hypothetical protein